MSARAPKVEIFKGSNGRWFFHKVAGNGKIVDQSQGYATKYGARRGAARVHPSVTVIDLS